MISTNTFVALLVFVAPFLVRADLLPTRPAPGDVYNEGSSCSIAWDGDTNSTTLWKNMTIVLMTGNNFEMEFITTVATGQDGTASGTFSYTCPNVTPNSAIYFYQFIAPDEINSTSWYGTGRFTLATSSGSTTPPANSIQPDGSKISWGIGKLVDPANAVPPPPFASPILLASSIVSNSNTSAVVTSSTTGSTTGSATGSATPVITSVVASPAIPLSTTASPTAQSASGAMTTFDVRVLGAAAAVICTLALSFVW